MPSKNPKMQKSECSQCGTVFSRPVGSIIRHDDPTTGKRCVGSILPTSPAF
ncbi:hypothetical protein SAMN05421505_1206 [Sinosporangium album]|uniref:Uncharacterized protein n=1 Tax=Sinosporangium album TaxID=504805 RepID=A0A1G8EAL1_9ACTN|nr:hypothetical protein [Sinosporangium album]SDH66739.1 hypothetical protein SAMN05421505_1206 [Sinosporangium album]